MTPQQAEKIINQYGTALSKGAEPIARPISLLPFSKAKVKYAFFVYIEELIKLKKIDKKMHDALIQSYIAIDSFIEDNEAHEINQIAQKAKSEKLSKEEQERFQKFLSQAYTNENIVNEIGDFILELLPE
jgi:hypothetical protein